MNPLTQIALDYHYNTELYDRSVCTGNDERFGCVARTMEENQKVQVNARQELLFAVNEAKKYNFTQSEIMKEINAVMVNGLFDFDRELEERSKHKLPTPIYREI